MRFETLTFNFSNAAIRHETLHGRDYLVVPTVMITEGVHNGSQGPLFYPAKTLAKHPAVWNMKPIVVYHPAMNGKSLSATDPVVAESQQVGILMNTRWDSPKLRTEAWLEESRLEVVDTRVMEALEANRMMEVSTGLFAENEEEDGEWGGDKYGAVVRNMNPDHLALLPDKIGACSVADGAGLLQLNELGRKVGIDTGRGFMAWADAARRIIGNALSHSEVHEALMAKLRAELGDEHVWIVEVWERSLVYEANNKLYHRTYNRKDGAITLKNGPSEVTRVTRYRKASGKFIKNDEAELVIENELEDAMSQEKIVADLIANEKTEWAEEDREALMAMNEKQLGRLTHVVDEAAKDLAVENAAKKGAEGVGAPAPAPAPVVENAEPVTLAAYIDNAPPEMQDVLRSGISAHNAEKAKLVKVIVANKQNLFSEAVLNAKPLYELEGIAALAVVNETPQRPIPNYGGQATPAEPTANDQPEEPLVMEKMEFIEK